MAEYNTDQKLQTGMMLIGIVEKGLQAAGLFLGTTLCKKVSIVEKTADGSVNVLYPPGAENTVLHKIMSAGLSENLSTSEKAFYISRNTLLYRLSSPSLSLDLPSTSTLYFIVEKIKKDDRSQVEKVCATIEMLLKAYQEKQAAAAKHTTILWQNELLAFRRFEHLLKPYLVESERYKVQIIYSTENNSADLWSGITEYIGRLSKILNLEAVIIGSPGYCTAVIPVMDNSTYSELLSQGEFLESSIAHVMNNFNIPSSLCIGTDYTREDITCAYRETLVAMKANILFGINAPVSEYDSLGVFKFIFKQDKVAIRQFIDRYSIYTARDGIVDSDLTDTVKALIDYSFSPVPTAKSLAINPSTLYYRINKIEQLLSLHLDDPVHRANLVTATLTREILQWLSSFE